METPPCLPLMNIYFSVHFHNSSNCFWCFHYETLDCFASLLENLELPIFTHCTVSAGDVNPNFPHCTEFINISQLWQLHIFTWIWQTEQSVICFVKFVLSSTFFDPAPLSTKRDSYWTCIVRLKLYQSSCGKKRLPITHTLNFVIFISSIGHQVGAKKKVF